MTRDLQALQSDRKKLGIIVLQRAGSAVCMTDGLLRYFILTLLKPGATVV